MAYGNMQIQRMPAAQVPQQNLAQQMPNMGGMAGAAMRQQGFGQQNRMSTMYGQQAQRQSGNPMMDRFRNQLRPGGMQGAGGQQGFPGQPPQQQAQAPWSFNQSNPWDPANFPGAQGGEQGLQRWLLQQAGQQGAFSGDYSQLLQPFRDAYQSDYGSGVRRSQLAGASGSMDPSQVAMMSRLGQSNAAGESSRAMSAAILQLLQGRQNMNENLLSSFVNHGNQWASADQQGLLNRLQQGEAQRGQGGGLGSLLGRGLGMGIGALTGGAIR